MARYRVQGPDGAVHVFEGPDDATPDQVTAAAQQQFGSTSATQSQAVAAPAPQESGLIANVAGGLLRGAGSIGATLLYPIDKATDLIKGDRDLMLSNLVLARDGKAPVRPLSRNEERRRDMDSALQTMGADPNSGAYQAGKVVSEVAGTLPVGGLVGKAIGALAPGAAQLATAVGSGGFRTGAALAPGAGVGARAVDIATRAAGGAIAGGASAGLVDPEQAGLGAAVGGALPGAMQVLSAAGNATRGVANAAKAVAEPLYQGGREAVAGRTLRRVAGDEADLVAQRLAAAKELVPGSAPTAGQAAENGGIAALERAVAAGNPAEFAERGMQQSAARVGALRNIAQDDTARAAAVGARKAASGPLYEQATKATYKLDGRLEGLMQTPVMQAAMARAKTLAENNQRPFAFNVEPRNMMAGTGARGVAATRQITGQGLQDVKMALDELLTDPSAGFTGAAGNAVKQIRGKLVNWMEDQNPAFKAARSTHAEMSKPIGQMDVGKELLTRLEPALNDYGGLARETGNKYATALRNADQTAVKATKFKGTGMRDLMTPDQMGSIEGVAADLARKANAQDLGRGVGSDTFQKLAVDNIAAQSGAPRMVAGALSLPGVEKVSKILYSGPEQKIKTLLAQALLNPAQAAQLMQKVAQSPGAGPAAQGPQGAVARAIAAARAKATSTVPASQQDAIRQLFYQGTPVAATGS